MDKKVTLEKAGAGIPRLEKWMLNRVIRLIAAVKDKDTLADRFLTESDKMIVLAESVEPADLSKKVLVARQREMEDSSRNWSVALTLDHLNIVNEGIFSIIKGLLKEEQATIKLPEVKVEDVKPREIVGEEMIDKFALMNQGVLDELVSLKSLKQSATHKHPWFGAMNAKQWLCLMVAHMGVHRKQIEAIIAGSK